MINNPSDHISISSSQCCQEQPFQTFQKPSPILLTQQLTTILYQDIQRYSTMCDQFICPQYLLKYCKVMKDLKDFIKQQDVQMANKFMKEKRNFQIKVNHPNKAQNQSNKILNQLLLQTQKQQRQQLQSGQLILQTQNYNSKINNKLVWKQQKGYYDVNNSNIENENYPQRESRSYINNQQKQCNNQSIKKIKLVNCFFSNQQKPQFFSQHSPLHFYQPFMTSIFSREKFIIIIDLYNTPTKIQQFLQQFYNQIKSFLMFNQKQWLLMKDYSQRLIMNKYVKNAQMMVRQMIREVQISIQQQEIQKQKETAIKMEEQLRQKVQMLEKQNRKNMYNDDKCMIIEIDQQQNATITRKQKQKDELIIDQIEQCTECKNLRLRYLFNLNNNSKISSRTNYPLEPQPNHIQEKYKKIFCQNESCKAKRQNYMKPQQEKLKNISIEPQSIDKKPTKTHNLKTIHQTTPIKTYKHAKTHINQKFLSSIQIMYKNFKQILFSYYSKFYILLQQTKQLLENICLWINKAQKFNEQRIENKGEILRFLLMNRARGTESHIMLEEIYKEVLMPIEKERVRVFEDIMERNKKIRRSQKNNEKRMNNERTDIVNKFQRSLLIVDELFQNFEKSMNIRRGKGWSAIKAAQKLQKQNKMMVKSFPINNSGQFELINGNRSKGLMYQQPYELLQIDSQSSSQSDSQQNDPKTPEVTTLNAIYKIKSKQNNLNIDNSSDKIKTKQGQKSGMLENDQQSNKVTCKSHKNQNKQQLFSQTKIYKHIEQNRLSGQSSQHKKNKIKKSILKQPSQLKHKNQFKKCNISHHQLLKPQYSYNVSSLVKIAGDNMKFTSHHTYNYANNNNLYYQTLEDMSPQVQQVQKNIVLKYPSVNSSVNSDDNGQKFDVAAEPKEIRDQRINENNSQLQSIPQVEGLYKPIAVVKNCRKYSFNQNNNNSNTNNNSFLMTFNKNNSSSPKHEKSPSQMNQQQSQFTPCPSIPEKSVSNLPKKRGRKAKKIKENKLKGICKKNFLTKNKLTKKQSTNILKNLLKPQAYQLREQKIQQQRQNNISKQKQKQTYNWRNIIPYSNPFTNEQESPSFGVLSFGKYNTRSRRGSSAYLSAEDFKEDKCTKLLQQQRLLLLNRYQKKQVGVANNYNKHTANDTPPSPIFAQLSLNSLLGNQPALQPSYYNHPLTSQPLQESPLNHSPLFHFQISQNQQKQILHHQQSHQKCQQQHEYQQQQRQQYHQQVYNLDQPSKNQFSQFCQKKLYNYDYNNYNLNQNRIQSCQYQLHEHFIQRQHYDCLKDQPLQSILNSIQFRSGSNEIIEE